MEKEKSSWRWPLWIVVIGIVLYFSRSFWPLFFQGEHYAELEAAISVDHSGEAAFHLEINQ